VASPKDVRRSRAPLTVERLAAACAIGRRRSVGGTMASDYVKAQHTLEECLLQDADVSELWEGRIGRKALREVYATWLEKFAHWKVFATLTFREDRSPDVALRIFFKLVRLLNQDLYGKNYKRIVKHSYFSYILATEYQLRGAIWSSPDLVDT